MPNAAAIRSARSALRSPPSVPAPAIRPRCFFAVRGSNRSLDDQPEPGTEKRAEGRDVQIDHDGAKRGRLYVSNHSKKKQDAAGGKGDWHQRRGRDLMRVSRAHRQQHDRHNSRGDDHGRERREAQRGEEQRVARGLAADKLRRDSARTEHGCHNRTGVGARKRHRASSRSSIIQGAEATKILSSTRALFALSGPGTPMSCSP